MPRTPEQAIAWGRAQIDNPTQGWLRLCLQFVRMSFDVQVIVPDAGKSWDQSKHKHRTSDPNSIPRGVPVYFELPSVADHVALSLGDGMCLSNDIRRSGKIDRVPIAEIVNKWGAQLLGWTEDVNGVKVYNAAPTPRPKGLRVDGVDISHYQSGAIDYDAAKKAGVRWIFHKATEGATWRDDNYAKRRAEAEKAGIPFGAYHFARPEKGDAKEEARAFLAYATPKPGDLGAALDLETTEGMSNDALDTWACTWGKVVKAATGGPIVLYTPFNLPKAQKLFDVIWRPRYNDDNRPPELAWDIFQFSNGDLGKPDSVAGFGHVDLNHMRDGLRTKHLRIPKPAPEPEPDDGPGGAQTLDVATWNAYVKNSDQGDGVTAVLEHAREVNGIRPKLVFVQENDNLPAEVIGKDLGTYQVVTAGTGRDKRCAILLPDRFPVREAYLLPGTPGIGSGVNQRPRRPLVVTTEMFGATVTGISAHPPYVGRWPSKKLRALHEEYARQVVAEACRLVADGHLVVIGGDGNHRPKKIGRKFNRALWQQLEEAGWTVVRKGLDLVAYRPEQLTPRGEVGTVPEKVTGSNHAGVVVPLRRKS